MSNIDLGGFPFQTHQYNNITPFTIRDGATYLQVLEDLREWWQDNLIPHIDGQFEALEKSWVETVEGLPLGIEEAINTQNGLMTTALNSAIDAAEKALVRANAAETSKQGAVDAASTSTTAAGISTTQAGIATTKASEAELYKTGADTAKTGAETAKTAAESARDLALAGQFAGSNMGSTVNLNTVISPGIYRQGTSASATPANNYPIASAGTLTVKPTTNVWLVQEYDTVGGNAAKTPRKFLRKGTLTDGVWIFSAWVHIPSQRVSTTAGRAIYTWDDVNDREQLIYYDSGLLDVSALLTNGWTGTVYLRRNNNAVELIAQNLVPGSTSAFISIPSGFRPPITAPIDVNPVTISRGQITSGGTGTLTTTGAAYSANSAKASWITTNTAPTALPGTAVGSIPA